MSSYGCVRLIVELRSGVRLRTCIEFLELRRDGRKYPVEEVNRQCIALLLMEEIHRNPAPVDIVKFVNIPLLARFHTCQVGFRRISDPSTV